MAYDHMGGRASQAWGVTSRVAPAMIWSPPTVAHAAVEVVELPVEVGTIVPTVEQDHTETYVDIDGGLTFRTWILRFWVSIRRRTS